ncbi:MAG: stage 0 sporulation family protein [Patescibacteria group bacterium]
MSIVQIKLAPWDKIFEAKLKKNKEIQFKIGDYLIVKVDSHKDLGKIVGILDKKTDKDKALIIRKANEEDLKEIAKKEKRKNKIIKRASEIINQLSLPIKLVDAHFSLDGGNIVFAFTAPERIDFRDLVKKLSKEFHRSIRLHQINPREEMRIFSGVGPCGRILCCLSFLRILGGVKTDFIQEQQLVQRGIERLSGSCGRLKCCLMYERDFYLEQAKKFPQIGTKIKTKDKEGEVVGWHILKESIDLKINEDTIIEVPISEIKEKI